MDGGVGEGIGKKNSGTSQDAHRCGESSKAALVVFLRLTISIRLNLVYPHVGFTIVYRVIKRTMKPRCANVPVVKMLLGIVADDVRNACTVVKMEESFAIRSVLSLSLYCMSLVF